MTKEMKEALQKAAEGMEWAKGQIVLEHADSPDHGVPGSEVKQDDIQVPSAEGYQGKQKMNL